MLELAKRFLEPYSNHEWQVEVRGFQKEGNYYAVIKDWTFVGLAFRRTGQKKDWQIDQHWGSYQGTLDECTILFSRLDPSWHSVTEFRIRNRVTLEVIPGEIFQK